MITNGEIRKQVTENIKPQRLKVFLYEFLYGLIIRVISGGIGAVLGVISSLIGNVLGVLICTILKIEDPQPIANAFSTPFTLISSAALAIFMAVFGVGLIRELLQLKSGNNASPVEFFKLGFKDYARTIKANLKYWVKLLPTLIAIVIANILIGIGYVGSSSEVYIIILFASVVLLYLFAGVWSFIYGLLYQALPYVLAKDEAIQDAKQVLAKSRDMLRGHFWQWTRMNLFYEFVNFIIVLAASILLTIGLVAAIAIVQGAGNGAVVIGIILAVVIAFLFILICLASALLMHYFSGKKVFNLDELYNAIEAERGKI